MPTKVQLYVYDLSMGMAAQLSPLFLGTKFRIAIEFYNLFLLQESGLMAYGICSLRVVLV